MDNSTDWTKYPGLPFAHSFEENFNETYHVEWYSRNWHLTLYAAIIYLIVVAVGVVLMRNREPFKLQLPLTLWSLTLSIFSIMAAFRLVPTSVHLIYTKGFIESAIDGSYNNDIRVKCWAWLFTISKVPEFLDTVFIIARKQKLIFLHWYHHFLTAPFCAVLFPEMTGAMIHYQAMNAFIHSMMYSYYTLKAMKIRVPGIFAMIITTSQIIQMIFGTIWSISLLALSTMGQDVKQSGRCLIVAALMYMSYLVLFVKFFIDSYSTSGGSKRAIVNGKKEA